MIEKRSLSPQTSIVSLYIGHLQTLSSPLSAAITFHLSFSLCLCLCLCLSCFLQKLQAIILLHTIHIPKHTLLFISIIKLISFETMRHYQEVALQRTTSTSTSTGRSSKKIIPSSNFNRSTSVSSSIPENEEYYSGKLLITRGGSHSPVSVQRFNKVHSRFTSLVRSLLNIIAFPSVILPTCKWLTIPTHLSVTPSLGRKVTGTLFGNRRGHVSFAVQDDPRSEPVLLLELAMSTATLVKEMASGLVRIALECEKTGPVQTGKARAGRLFHEPMWTMYCNGRKCGYATSRACGGLDWHVLTTVQSVSVGAGVIPVVEDGRKAGASEGELLYMRARFERVVGSRDSEAFYMLNPDNNGGPELSIFLLRI